MKLKTKNLKLEIISGPCSIESLPQFTSVVESLAALPQVSMIRCGVWKPRTMPGGFEGLGEEALLWIDEQKKAHPQLKFCCEVANARHVEATLNHSIDAVWIGARTTGSPFAVEEITEALRGCHLPVFVKNSPVPDIHVWIGALERCRKVGLNHIAAIHRGFDIYNNLGYRNNPLWEIPMELHRIMPDLPLICDPSHICGRREMIAQVSQTALDLHFDGLMIEVHPNPDLALTDARQQLSPAEFKALLEKLTIRTTDENNCETELQQQRRNIDEIDRQILELLAQRQKASQAIALIKKRANMTVFQPNRWNDLLNDHLRQAESLGLDPAYIKEIFEKIHTESVRRQEAAINNA